MTPQDPFGLVGTTIDGKYRIEEVVGQGGFAVIYRAVHEGFGDATVAVKCLKLPEGFSAEGRSAFVETFRREGKLLLQLGSEPGIVRVLDLGVANSAHAPRVPFLVLEWLEGSTLAEVLEERRQLGLGPYTEREALQLIRPIAHAVASAHLLPHAKGRGVAHRDLKPSNIMQTSSARGEVWKVLDFGIAKAMQAGDRATLASGTPLNVRPFSAPYGAPEQFHPVHGPTGPWTDVHALGLLLVELLTGKPALDGKTAPELFASAASDVRPTPRSRGAAVSDACEQLCAKALAKRPADRFANAQELVIALDAILEAERVSIRQAPPPSAPRSQPRNEARTMRALTYGVAVVAALLASIAVWRWLAG